MTDNDETIEYAKRSMLGRLIWFCLTNKLVVLLLVIATLGWGVMVAPFDWETGALPRDPVPVDAIPDIGCLLYTSPSPRDLSTSRMPSSA